MAYASTVAVSRAGDRVRVTVTETDADATTEATLEIGQQYLTLLSQEFKQSAGGAGGFTPSLSTKSAGTAGDGLLYTSGDSTGILNSRINVQAYSADGKYYHRAEAARLDDNDLVTVYTFKIGW